MAKKQNINIRLLKATLRKREIEVIRLICEENTSAQIAKKLGLSMRTVEFHRAKCFKKLGINNTVGLVKFAIRSRIYKL